MQALEKREDELRELEFLLKEATTEVDDLKSQLAAKEGENEILISKLVESKKRVAELTKSLKGKEKEIYDLKKRVSRLLHDVETLKTKNKNLEKEIERLQKLLKKHTPPLPPAGDEGDQDNEFRDNTTDGDGRILIDENNPFWNCYKKDTFWSQRAKGLEIAELMTHSDIDHVLLYAPTQSGKTGVALSTAFYTQMPHIYANIGIPFENIYVITGLSSNEWKTQTRERFPPDMASRILHLWDIRPAPHGPAAEQPDIRPELKEELMKKKNVLFIVDEMHIAAQKNQTLFVFLRELGLTSHDDFTSRNVKMLHISATPEGSWERFQQSWKGHCVLTHMIPHPKSTYIGLKQLLQNGQIRQSSDLCAQLPSGADGTSIPTPECVKHIVDIHTQLQSYDVPKFHIIRAGNTTTSKKDGTVNRLGMIRENITYVFSDILGMKMMPEWNGDLPEEETLPTNCFAFIHRATGGSSTWIEELVKNTPKCHTIILLKQEARCAVTIDKSHLGIAYENFVQGTSDVLVQAKYFNRNRVLGEEIAGDGENLSKFLSLIKRESTVVQSLVGRITGYYRDKRNKENMLKTVVYTDVLLVEAYIRDTWDFIENDKFNKTNCAYNTPLMYYNQEPNTPLPVGVQMSPAPGFQGLLLLQEQEDENSFDEE